MKKSVLVILFLVTSGGISYHRPAHAVQRTLYNPGPLILEGKVKRLENDSEGSRSIGLKATLLLTFKNIGTKPIIMYRHDLWLGGVFLSRSVEEARAYRFILDSSAWPSVWGRDSREKLHRALDQQDPPADLTLTLQPGESWQYEKVTHFGIDKKESPEAQGLPWNEIRSLSPVWLFVMFEMWPVNAEPRVDPDNPRFGLMLRKRWKTSGELWLDYLTSQPIRLDLKAIQN
jgi:hypothetical protein